MVKNEITPVGITVAWQGARPKRGRRTLNIALVLYVITVKLPDEKRRQFAHNYDANCLKIARDIAGLLIAGKSQPFIACRHKEEDRVEGRFHYPLMPKKYKGRVTWTIHYVCCCDGMVYDPMLEEPVRIEQYSMAVFGEDSPSRYM